MSGGAPKSQRSEPTRIATSIGGASAASPTRWSAVSEPGALSTSSTAPSGGAPTLAGANGEAANVSSLKVPVGGARRSGTGPAGSPSGSGSGSRASSANTSTLWPCAGLEGGVEERGGIHRHGLHRRLVRGRGERRRGRRRLCERRFRAGGRRGGGRVRDGRRRGGDGLRLPASTRGRHDHRPEPPGLVGRDVRGRPGSFCSMLAGVPPSATAMAVELAVLHRDALARRERLELVERAEVRREARDPRGCGGAGRRCRRCSSRVGGEHAAPSTSCWARAPPTSTPHDPARTHRSLSGIGHLAALVRHELAAAQAGASGHFRQRETLLAADGPQVLAQLLRRDGQFSRGRLGHGSSYRRSSGCACRVSRWPSTPWATSSPGSIPTPTSIRTRRSSATSPSAPGTSVWPQAVLRGDYGVDHRRRADVGPGRRGAAHHAAAAHHGRRRRRDRSPRAPRVLHRARRHR